MNITGITGRLTRDAAFTENAAEPKKNRALMTVAVTDARNSKNTDFFNVVCWGSKADFVRNGLSQGRYLKGCEVEVTGHVHLNTYKNRDGQERSSLELYAENSYSKVHPNAAQSQGSQGQQYQGQQGGYQQQYATVPAGNPNAPGYPNVPGVPNAPVNPNVGARPQQSAVWTGNGWAMPNTQSTNGQAPAANQWAGQAPNQWTGGQVPAATGNAQRGGYDPNAGASRGGYQPAAYQG